MPSRLSPTESAFVSSPILAAPTALLTPEGKAAISDWSLSPDAIHLNHGSYGAVPRAAQAKQRELQGRMDANPCAWFKAQPGKMAQTRADVADFLGVSGNDLALVANASAGISSVYNSLTFHQGAEIVATDHAYGAVLEGARRVARENNGQVRVATIPLDADADLVCSRVMEQVTDRTALIVIDQVTSATAREFPVVQIATAAGERGIPVLVDGAHSPGVMAAPVPEFEGFWVGNLHKFSCAPRGTAALVARGPLRDCLHPLTDSWGYPFEFPENFDHVGTLDTTAWMSATTAFDTIENRYGWQEARDYAAALAGYGQRIIQDACNVLSGRDDAVDVGMPVGPLKLVRLPVGLVQDSESAAKVRTFLAEQLGFETAITAFNGIGYLRLSAHIYNTSADYEAFAERAVPELFKLAQRA